QLRAEESTVRQRLTELTDSVHTLELQINERKLQLNSGLEKVANELSLTETVLLTEYGPGQPDPVDGQNDSVAGITAANDGEITGELTEPYDRQKQQRRLAIAQRQYDQLGRVNPLALEEFAALEQRHSYLVEQLDDLHKTRKDLMTIIGDLDEKMQTIFMAAFEDTSEER